MSDPRDRSDISGHAPGPIVFYDGACPLCRALVAWCEARRGRVPVTFLPLQGAGAGRLLPRACTEAPSSLVFLEGGELTVSSGAVLKLLGTLRCPWRWLRFLAWLPRPLRDGVYGWVARRRHVLSPFLLPGSGGGAHASSSSSGMSKGGG